MEKEIQPVELDTRSLLERLNDENPKVIRYGISIYVFIVMPILFYTVGPIGAFFISAFLMWETCKLDD